MSVLLTTVVGAVPTAVGAVHYHGLRLSVPDDWRVYRLDHDPTRCVRYDRHALYLGRGGADQNCPAHAVGRTGAMRIEPLGDRPGVFGSGAAGGGRGRGGIDDGTTLRLPAERLSEVTVHRNISGELRIAVPDVGVLVTVSYGASTAEVRRVLRSIRLGPSDRAAPSVPTPRGTRPEPSAPAAGAGRRPAWVRGPGFDTCKAPSLAAMRAWRADFVAANIYIGGAARTCSDGNLSASWIRAVEAMGWRLIPTYVGPQAPCSSYRPDFTAAGAAAVGRRAADDAVRRAKAFGLPKHSPIYYDMEAYDDPGDGDCGRAVVRLVDAWSRRLTELGYVSGFYGSTGSGIRDVGRAKNITKPAAVWLAHWDGRARVRDPDVPDAWWPGHRRIKQYRGPHEERHGGVTIRVDNDMLDGPVA